MRPDTGASRLRVLFYVQHLLGIGHLHRAARVAKALSEQDFAVRLVLGGLPPPWLDVGDAEIVQLPPVKAGPDGFSKLVHPDGRVFDAGDEVRRTELLLRSFDQHAPDILLTEAFPFGRRQMRFELLPLLEHARARQPAPLVAASVRDILQQVRQPARVAETIERVRSAYDLVLVHGDPAFAAFDASFPAADRIADKLAYTGLVAPPPPAATLYDGEAFGAVVSVGGGAVGAQLLRASLSARPMTRLADQPWLVLIGPNGPSGALAAAPDPGIRIERFVPDLARVLSRSQLSVSQAGYNTVADILAADIPAVVVPFAEGGETEQTERAARLAAANFATVVPEASLSPARLAAAIETALDQLRPRNRPDLDGARATGRLLRHAFTNRSR